jgi:hypothetical protein
MPKKEWFEQNPKVSAYLSPELNTRLRKFMDERGISRTSQALSVVLEEYFSLTPEQESSSTDKRLANLEMAIARLQKELREVQQSRSTVVQDGLPEGSNSKPIVVQSSPLQRSDGWLTTGKAYEEMQRRGYTKSIGTFRRSLKNGVVPTELEQIGLEADWSTRSQANSKDNSVKWLKF